MVSKQQSASYQRSESVRDSGDGRSFPLSALRLRSPKRKKKKQNQHDGDTENNVDQKNEFPYLIYESRYLLDTFSLSITVRATITKILNATQNNFVLESNSVNIIILEMV